MNNLRQFLQENKKNVILFLIALFCFVFFIVAKNLFPRLPKVRIKAAPYEAVFVMIPSNDGNPGGVTLQAGDRRKIELMLATNAGTTPADINGVEYKITYNPTKIKIVDQNGTQITQVSTAGNIFETQNPFIAQNSISNGVIYLSMMSISGSFQGAAGLVGSFYIEPLASSGSDVLSFVSVVQDSTTDFMHAYQKTGQPPYPDILSATKMNGSAKSKLTVNLGNPSTASLSLIQSSSTTVRVGDEFDALVEVSTGGRDIMGADVVLQYDASQLNLVSPGITRGNIFASYSSLTIPSSQTGTMTLDFSGWSLPGSNPPPPYNSSTNSDHRFATLRFRALRTGTASVNFVFSGLQASTTDSNLLTYYQPGIPKNISDDILAQVNNLSVTVSTAVTPTPTRTPTPVGPTATRTPTPPPTNTPVPGATNTPVPYPTIPPSGGIVINGNFETGDLNSFSHGGASVSTTAVYTGSYGLILNGDSAYASQNIASRLQTGIEYVFTAWVKVVTAGNSWGSPKLRCSRYSDLGTSDYGDASAQNNTGAGWQYLQFRKMFNSSELSGGIHVGVKHFGTGGKTYADDIYVYAAGAPTPTTPPVISPTRTPTPTQPAGPTPTKEPNRCADFPADVNGDAIVDSMDVSIVVAGWGTKFSTNPPTYCPVDLNSDQKVNAADIQVLISWWGLTWPR